MQKSAYIRLGLALFICFSVMMYHIKDIFVPIKKEEILSDKSASSITEIIQEPESEEGKETETEEKNESENETVSNSEENSSVEVSAKDVKGKIIEKYISPYNSNLSYDKVYIKNSTGVSVDIKKLLEAPLSFNIEKNNDKPQILIMHTHTTESFMSEGSDYYTSSFSPRSRDNSKNMVKIGEIIAERLNSSGIKTLHDKTQHDYPEYTGSYTRSKKTINSYLNKYPSIKIVLDLHRDSVSTGDDKTKLTTEINGKKAAQVMLVMGSQTGSVEGHSKWQENLKLAFKLQQCLEQKYPTLARPLMLVSKLYNQNLTTGSLLIEFGTDVNSLDEVCYSAELVAKVLEEMF